jgi:uncharacterized membrane protein
VKPSPWLIVVLAGAVLGLVFAGVSTYDFVQHLDRQVHALHCSFIPGLGKDAGTSGCQTAMMSPYSSVFRSHVWGGVPIALPAMSVFAFLAFFTTDLLVTRRKHDPRATAFLALATALPALVSILMLTLSLTKLGTTCKLCVGIYIASAACLVGAIMQWREATRANHLPIARVREPRDDKGEPAFVGKGEGRAAKSSPRLEVALESPPATNAFLATAFGIGVAFVVVPVVLYLVLAPDHSRFIGTCDGLTHPDDTYGVMVDMSTNASGAPTVEVLDPLCPACKAFEQRLDSSGLADRLSRKAVLFPLDNTCNWMVTEATHRGACTVSEAVLCAGKRAPEVIAWAFDVQDRIRAEAKTDPTAAARIVKDRFPDLANCVGSPDAKSKLNKSLRWSVANGIRVLTPQVFVGGVKLCDEDVDLGLEYTLTRMLDRLDKGELKGPAPAERPALQPDPADVHGHQGDSSSGKSTSDKSSGDTSSPDKSNADKSNADKSNADKSSSDKLSADKSNADKSSTDKSNADKSNADKSNADKSSGDKPAGDKSSGDKSTGDKSSGDKPAGDKPSGDKPAGDKPNADKPASDRPASEGGTP